MAIWPFNRKKREEQALPDEVKEYYESGRKQKKGMAWLLALGTLLVTVILATLLFLGGRWVYDKLAGDDEQTPPAAQNDQDQLQQDQAQGPDVNPDPDADSDPADQPATTQQGTSSTNTAQSSNNSATPSTGSTGSEIPDTGPGPGGLQ